MQANSTRAIVRGGCIFASLLFPLIACLAHAQNQGGGGPGAHVVYLPDPTPRSRPLDKVYGPDEEKPSNSDQVISERNAKRRELEVWAADELVTLSEKLQAELSGPKTAASSSTAAAHAEKIEQLAKNLATAMKAK